MRLVIAANMLDLPRSPPAFQPKGIKYCDPTGLNFAYGDAGVFRFEYQSATIREQVNLFETMIGSGTISENHVAHSIALLAVSGHDYKQSFRNVSSTYRVGVAGHSDLSGRNLHLFLFIFRTALLSRT